MVRRKGGKCRIGKRIRSGVIIKKKRRRIRI
jgi:hypothetical protein